MDEFDAVGAIEHAIIAPHVGHLVEVEERLGDIVLYCHTCQQEIMVFLQPERDADDYDTDTMEV